MKKSLHRVPEYVTTYLKTIYILDGFSPIRVRFEDPPPPISINFVNTNLIKIKLSRSVYFSIFKKISGPSAAARAD